ncbi:Hypothetical protein R9X50_00278300 [Acrodontium crateriforme]|uniref:Uncharacterized protein n=1 Tax=Acrodontium crateriforme TaxID=150365 RepID=A0AAQ3R3S1_9PEZI|nr:Hypothetical protein R9X50_00278300 [Acrodontium crateriforme]
MSAAHVVRHVMRRGVEAAHSHFQQASPEYIAKLQQDAELYEQAGPEMELSPEQFLPVLITAIIAVLIMASVRYTLGDLMASLAMIESPSTTAIIEPKPPAYADEPDAPLEKEPLMPSEAEADVEVTIINHKPITGRIRTTMAHLSRVGGFFAKWRGAGAGLVYHLIHGFIFVGFSFFMNGVLNTDYFGEFLAHTFTSVLLARLHMLWTQKMVACPQSTSLLRRGAGWKQHKALLLPSFVYAAAEQVMMLIASAAASMAEAKRQRMTQDGEMHGCLLAVLPFLALVVSGLFVALAVLLPASVTLTRIEASLLPEDVETIVPFDREAVIGSIDTSARGGCRALFVQAWRSFDRSARLRLIKLYVKMILVQVAVAFVAVHVMVAELYLIGGEKLAIFIKSGVAQLKLMAIEAQSEIPEAN